jgi:methionyl-tRNA synthetase
VALVRRFGTDALRWWLLREVPRVGDVDFTEERLAGRANADLAGGLGNLVSRTVAMVHRYRDGVVPGGHRPPPADPAAQPLAAACQDAAGQVGAALDGHDFRAATAAVWRIVDEANRYIELTQPWQLAKAERPGTGSADAGPAHAGQARPAETPAGPARLDAVLAHAVAACRCLAVQLEPFVPGAAARVAAQCGPDRLPAATPVFARVA